MQWQKLSIDAKNNWFAIDDSLWQTYIPMTNIFNLNSMGVGSSRDAYAYSYSKTQLITNIKNGIDEYNGRVDNRINTPHADLGVSNGDYTTNIKWTPKLIRSLSQNKYNYFDATCVRDAMYRPFVKQHLYFNYLWNENHYQLKHIFPAQQSAHENPVISVSAPGNWWQWQVCVINAVPNNHLTQQAQCFPFYTYDEDGANRQENITDNALKHFQAHYRDSTITKWDIFYYIYAILHHIGYHTTHIDNLRRELPRIPLAKEFFAFSQAGKALADLHLDYEMGKRYSLDWQVNGVIDTQLDKMKRVGDSIVYNKTLTLANIPQMAWEYKFDNRSVLELVIDFYRVQTDTRSGITNDPNKYSDNPFYLIELIERLTHVSIETVSIIKTLSSNIGIANLPT